MHGARFEFPDGRPLLYKAVLVLLVTALLGIGILAYWIPQHSDRQRTPQRPVIVRFQSKGVLYVSHAVRTVADTAFFLLFATILAAVLLPYYYESKGKAVRIVKHKRDVVTELGIDAVKPKWR